MSFTRRSATTLGLAALSTLIFAFLSRVTGAIGPNEGLGWDGVGYADLVTDRLVDATAFSWGRRLIPLLIRVPYALTGDMILSFRLMNHVFTFGLAWAALSIFDHYNKDLAAKAFFVANVFLSIAIGKMFAFYPVLADLGAYAVLTAAVYFSISGRRVLAGLTCCLAVIAREFAAVALVFGAARDVRERKVHLGQTLATYGPALACFVLLRVAQPGPEDFAANRTSLDALAGNIFLWQLPVFVVFFLYFALTTFGGVSALLATRLAMCFRYLRREPEWIAMAGLILAAAVVGHADMWRYLAYTLPVASMLFARCARDLGWGRQRLLLLVATTVTLMTQRPWELMSLKRYFRDWFPVYVDMQLAPLAVLPLWPVWTWRFLALAIAMLLLTNLQTSTADSLIDEP